MIYNIKKLLNKNFTKSIQQIEKEQMARLKAKAQKGKLMLDE